MCLWAARLAIKGDTAICSNCNRSRQAQVRGIIVNGPKCACGQRDWLVGESGARCSNCDRGEKQIYKATLSTGQNVLVGLQIGLLVRMDIDVLIVIDGDRRQRDCLITDL